MGVRFKDNYCAFTCVLQPPPQIVVLVLALLSLVVLLFVLPKYEVFVFMLCIEQPSRTMASRQVKIAKREPSRQNGRWTHNLTWIL